MRNTLLVRTTSRTFKAVLVASLAGALLASVVPSASAATTTVGGVCTKVGTKAKVSTKVKVGTKARVVKISVQCKAVSGKKI